VPAPLQLGDRLARMASSSNFLVRTSAAPPHPRELTCTHSRTPLEENMSTTMTVRLDDDVKDRLDHLAEATNRSKSYLAAEAIRDFVEINEWQIKQTKAALTEAKAGDFATDKEVQALAKKWKVARAG
jgi:predicted transcriptional regulator